MLYDETFNVAYCAGCVKDHADKLAHLAPEARPVTEAELRGLWHNERSATCAHCEKKLY